MNNSAIFYLSKLARMDGFKMDGTTIEVQGIRFHWSHYNIEEGILEGLVYIAARLEARRMVTEATVVLKNE